MAGEAVLSTFMQVLFEKLYTAASEELRSLRGVSKELDGISSTLTIIQALLEDAEEKQLTEKPVRIWLSKLKNVAYDMDELLDNYQAQRLKHEIERTSPTQRSKKMVRVSGFFSPSLHKGLINYKAAYKIKAIHKKLDMFAREREILGLQILGNATRLEVVEQPQTSSLVDESNVFGREVDREKIITMLLSAKYNSMMTNFSVLPIVGMGGLGKTNLTQRVYNDSRVKEYFELRMWICVSSNFDEIKLTKEALQSVVSGNLSTIGTGYLSASGYLSATSGSAAPNMNLLQEELREGLKGKKFLLVLDDVWNENPQKWERFCISLRGARRGSRIIVTTQNANVGTTMGALPPYHLDRLSDDDCWNLFRNCAFVDGNSSGHSNLEKIGKEIVKKLKGLPLAAKALGSLLYSKLDEEYWRNILTSEIWELPKDKNNIPYPVLPSPAEDAEALRKACKGWGTDDKGIIEVMAHRGATQRKLIREAYEEIYGENLIKRLESELSGAFERAVYRWMLDPLEREAIIANVAVKENDYSVLVEVACINSTDELLALKQVYHARYKHSFEEDVASNITGDFRAVWQNLKPRYFMRQFKRRATIPKKPSES